MEKEDIFEEIIDIGKRHGELTYDEINDALPSEYFSMDELEELMDLLHDMGVEVVDNHDPDTAEEEILASEEEEEDTEDLVQAYFHSMGNISILRGMIAEGIKTRWSAQVRTDVARDPELLRLMADSGCHTLFIGFESVNPGTLEAYNKKQGLEDIISCIRTVRDHGIHIHGMFVLGADTDDVETIRGTADFAISHGIDTVQFLILTPLPGTPLFHDMMKSGRLLHTDWSKYDVQHAVFSPMLMSTSTLQIETFRAMGRFYSWRYIFRHLARLDFHYAAIGVFGKTSIHKALKSSSAYLHEADIRKN